MLDTITVWVRFDYQKDSQAVKIFVKNDSEATRILKKDGIVDDLRTATISTLRAAIIAKFPEVLRGPTDIESMKLGEQLLDDNRKLLKNFDFSKVVLVIYPQKGNKRNFDKFTDLRERITILEKNYKRLKTEKTPGTETFTEFGNQIQSKWEIVEFEQFNLPVQDSNSKYWEESDEYLTDEEKKISLYNNCVYLIDWGYAVQEDKIEEYRGALWCAANEILSSPTSKIKPKPQHDLIMFVKMFCAIFTKKYPNIVDLFDLSTEEGKKKCINYWNLAFKDNFWSELMPLCENLDYDSLSKKLANFF